MQCKKRIRLGDLDERVTKRLRLRSENEYPHLESDEQSPYSLTVFATDGPFDQPEDDIVWRCPREAHTESSGHDPRCWIHAPDATGREILDRYKKIREAGPKSVLAIDEPDPANRNRFAEQLVGIDVERLDLSELDTDGGQFPLDLRLSHIGSLRCDNVQLNKGLRLDGCHLGDASLHNARLDGPLLCQGAVCDDEFNADGATIRGSFHGSNARFRNHVSVNEATIDGTIQFHASRIARSLSTVNTEIDELLWLRECDIGWNLNCRGALVDGHHHMGDITAIQLNEASIGGSVELTKVRCQGSLLGTNLTVTAGFSLEKAEIERSVWLGGVNNDVADLERAEIGGSLDVTDATIGEELEINGSEDGLYDGTAVDGAVELRGAVIGTLLLGPDQTTCSVVDGRDSEVETLKLDRQQSVDHPLYDFTGASVGEIEFLSEHLELKTNIRFFDTEFGKFDSSRERKLLDSGGWQIHTVDDAEQLSRGRRFADSERLGIDIVALCATIPGFRDCILEGNGPGAAALLDPIFRSKDDAVEAAVNGPMMDYIPHIVSERERLRRGFVTRLAEHVHRDKYRREVVALLENSDCREELRSLAETAAAPDGVPAERVPTREETVTALNSFASVLSSAVADSSDIDTSAAGIESTYLKARKGADATGDTIAVGEFYMRELRARRDSHWDRLVTRNNPVGALKDYLSNWALWALTGYGERPSHVFISSLAVIFVFAAVYAGLSVSLDILQTGVYRGGVGYLLLSFESFIAFVLGGAAVDSRLIRLLADIEGFVGAFLIGLFVFTLTRSINR